MSSERFGLEPLRDETRQATAHRPGLIATAIFLTFEPGLYAVVFRCASESISDIGLPLPCARIEPLVLPHENGHAFVIMTPKGGWLSHLTSAAHVLVVGGNVSAMLTIYRLEDEAPTPEVHFQFVLAWVRHSC